MSRRIWSWLRPLTGVAIIAVLVARLGLGAFLDAVREVDARSLAAAVGVALLTTICCAWRWRLVARGLGVELPLPTAVAAYYRSQFLNTTLPGGVLGDVHRGVLHGRDAGDVGRGLRTVAWERTAGQAVQIVVAIGLLLVLPSPLRSSLPLVTAATVAAVLGFVLLGRALPHGGPSLLARSVRTVSADLRHGLLARRAWPGIALASVIVVAGHTVIFLIAARTAGVTASPIRLLPLALVVLLAMSVPMNVAGWGPREGVAAWVFGVAGLGAGLGLATAVVYGVLALVASLPGAVVLVAWRRRDAGTAEPATTADPEGVARG